MQQMGAVWSAFLIRSKLSLKEIHYPRMTDRKVDNRLGCACGDQLVSYFNISDRREGGKEEK